MKPSIPALVVSAIVTVACIAVSYDARGGAGNALWDLSAYTRAVHDYRDGINPYRTDVSDVFVYHPFVLTSFYLLDTAPVPRVERFNDPLRTWLLASYLLAAACFLWQLWRFASEHAPGVHTPRTDRWVFALLILGAVGYGQAGATAYLSGNLTAYLHLGVLAMLLKCLRSRSDRLLPVFVGAVGAASLVKPYMLAYLLVCFVMTTRMRALRHSGIAAACVACAWLSAAYLMPAEYDNFLTALRHQTIVTGDLGYSVLGLGARYVPYDGALIAHVLIMGALSWVLCVELPRREALQMRSAAGVLLLVAFTILMNPRMKEYDMFVLVLVLFWFLYLRWPAYALPMMCVAVFTSAVPLFNGQLRRLGYEIPGLSGDTHYSEMAGLLSVALTVWLFRPASVIRDARTSAPAGLRGFRR